MALNLVRSCWLGVLQGCPGPLINKSLAASAWVGSYRIRNPEDFIDTFPKPDNWPRRDEAVQPPQTDPKEERRPANYHYARANIRVSPKKMWFVTKYIRGMSIDEAIKQCKFLPFKSAQIMARCLADAQELAVRENNFEFKSNIWIQDAHSVKGLTIKGVKRHARFRFGTVHYFYTHVLLKLTEGEPPKHFYVPPKNGNDLLRDYFDELRSRKIAQGL